MEAGHPPCYPQARHPGLVYRRRRGRAEVYGAPEVARWLPPVIQRVPDLDAVRALLRMWRAEQPTLGSPQGRWAVERRSDGTVVDGLAIGLMPPFDEDLEWRGI